MDHTIKRLLMHINDRAKSLSEQERKALQIVCKWGCDGSQENLYEDGPSNIIQSSFIPLKLVCSFNNKIIWQNPMMWSTRYCRAIKIRFEKLTPDIMLEEIDYIKNGISTLKASKILLYNKTFTVEHKMIYTEIDEKVCNADVHANSTPKCYICNRTTKDFNNLSMVKKDIKVPEMLEFGLSITHIRTRLFESLLYLSYKLPLKKWETNDNDASIIKQRKIDIKNKFRMEMDLLVDRKKLSGNGTYNNGWASRKFFLNPEQTAKITGINIDLIKRFKVILETISCKYKIQLNKFAAYAHKTAEMYVELYPWCPMTPTMHKILMHGPIIIQHSIIAIGQLSRTVEKVQNKLIPLFNDDGADLSQTECNKQILDDLLARSDPLITGMSSSLERKKKIRFLIKETSEMLLPTESEMPQDNASSDEDDYDGEDSELSSDEN
ncbi:uncharacterized protein [Eurosta solidaginis]|uniref:uncharacterized protein n=1 Tax=Eurosta solidaginis TaxID=178769 RepID=UPI00353139AF